MQSIEEASKEYENQELHIEDGQYTSTAIIEAFTAGVEFAQQWIKIEDELPPLNTLLQVKGIVEGGKIGYDFAKFEFKKGLCAYHLIRATHWRPINIE